MSRSTNSSVVALEIERSFWEKATILHTEFYRPTEKTTPDRFSRHYADTASLAKHPAALLAINQDALRERVVEWKSRFFGSSWAKYEWAKPGTRKHYQRSKHPLSGFCKGFSAIGSVSSNALQAVAMMQARSVRFCSSAKKLAQAQNERVDFPVCGNFPALEKP